MENELKPCPFCGGEAQCNGFEKDYPLQYCQIYVKCNSCGAEINIEGRTLITEKLEQIVIDAWNNRAEPEDKEQQLCKENENFIQNKFGYCFYSLDPCPLIYNLYVHSQYRRKGHSSKLLMFAISEIRENGYRGKIYIQVEPKENSISKEELTQYYEERGLAIYNSCKPEAPNA